MGFEICYNNGSVEKGYEALYGAGIGAGATESYEKTFTVPAETVAGNLVLQFQLGSSPAENDFTVNSVTVEKLIPEHTEIINVEAAYTELQTSLSASEGHDAGYEQTLDGNSRALTISAVPPRENGVWKSKLFVDTGMAPTAGEKYRVTADVTSGKAFAFEICFNNGAAEKGYGALYGQSIGAGETKSFALEFEVSADVVTNNLVLQFQLGDSPADNTFTVSGVTVEKWTEATDSEPVTTVDPKSFELWAHETYTAELSGDGSSAAVNFTASPDGSLEVWKTKLFANTGVTLEGGKSYRISADVQAASNLLYEICYNDGGTEKGVGALYNLTATAEAQTVTFEVTPENSASLVIQFSLGNAATGNSVTVSNIYVEELGETTGDNLLTDPLTAWAPVHHWADGGYDVSLSNTGSSASADVSAVPSDQADWKLKLFIETGAQLTAGKQYRIRYNIQADSSFDYNVFYNNGAEEKAVGEFYGLNTGAAAVEHIVTPGNNATLTIQLMLGTTSAPNHVTVSNVQVEEIVYASGEPQHGSVNFWAHEDYEAALSGTESSASLAITKVPETDRAGWKVKLFAETGTELKAGRTYRISLDVQATAEQDYEICFNNLEHEAALGVLQNLSASTEKQTVTYTITPENAAVLTLQLNLGLAGGANTITISGLKVEQVSFDTGTSVIPSFRYDTVGYISTASDDGYVVSLDQHESSADFYIHHAPSKRNPWNVKLNVKTGLTPKAGKGYRVTFELIATKAQNLFEVFYDGKTEAAYGALYEQSLKAGKNKVSFLIMPDSGTGALSLQIRLGKTNGTDGNSYTFRNLKIEEVGFTSSTAPEIKAVTYLWTHEDYSSALAKTPDKATVRIEKTPETGKEPWKTKLFVDTGVQLKPGEKYRISFNVKSIIPAPFEVCFNNGDEEKGLGGMFGLFSSPAGHYVEFVTYAKQDTHLVIQLSLGNCIPPNSIILSGLKVEKAGTVNLISDTIYTF